MSSSADSLTRLALLLVVAAISTAAAASSVSTKSANKPKATVPAKTRPAAPPPTITTGPLPTAPGTKKTPPTPPGAWPAATSGYTNILASIPVSAGIAVAQARARAARAAGLPRVGVLDSSRYPSLHGGYYVVFSGVYPTATQAAEAIAQPHARGFTDAYEARVTP